jgi:hypothetical protein
MDADKLSRPEALQYLTHRLTENVPAPRSVHHDVRAVGFDPADVLHVHRRATKSAPKENPFCARTVERLANPVERRAKACLRHRLHDVITGGDIERPRGKLRMRRDEDDVFHEGADDVLYLESIDMGHANVEKHDVRANLAHRRGNVARVGTFSDDIEIGGIMEQLAKALAGELFIIDKENPVGTRHQALPA